MTSHRTGHELSLSLPGALPVSGVDCGQSYAGSEGTREGA